MITKYRGSNARQGVAYARLAVLASAAAVAAPATALAGTQPGSPPLICSGSAFTDVVGTAAGDEIASANRAERVYGLRGDDRLLGSRTRATCLFGGLGDDFLNLNAGGGVAWGEEGRDIVFGSRLGDVVDGGTAIDGLVTGDGPDKISARDGLGELIACGDGDDIVRGDRADVYMDCESVTATGRALPALTPQPRVTDIGGTVRARFTAPRAGDYRVLYVTTAQGRNCSGGPFEVAAHPGLRRGQRIRLVMRRPQRGWCEGTSRFSVVRDPGYGLPLAPVARVVFQVL